MAYIKVTPFLEPQTLLSFRRLGRNLLRAFLKHGAVHAILAASVKLFGEMPPEAILLSTNTLDSTVTK